MCISTVADIPNTKKNRRVFPAISLKDMPMIVVVGNIIIWESSNLGERVCLKSSALGDHIFIIFLYDVLCDPSSFFFAMYIICCSQPARIHPLESFVCN